MTSASTGCGRWCRRAEFRQLTKRAGEVWCRGSGSGGAAGVLVVDGDAEGGEQREGHVDELVRCDHRTGEGLGALDARQRRAMEGDVVEMCGRQLELVEPAPL